MFGSKKWEPYSEKDNWHPISEDKEDQRNDERDWTYSEDKEERTIVDYWNNWERLDAKREGSCNLIFINKTKKLVFKTPATLKFKTPQSPEEKKLNSSEQAMRQMDTPERSVEIWNKINPKRRAKQGDLILWARNSPIPMKGWFCPFIEGKPASPKDDKEISDALIDIFNRTGRIIVDAPNKNFIKTKEGEMVCIDVGFALKLEAEDNKSTPFLIRNRSKSDTSDAAWTGLEDRYREEFFENHKILYPKTIKTIKSLLFIKKHFPYMSDVSFLSESYIDDLANAYDDRCDVFLMPESKTHKNSDLNHLYLYKDMSEKIFYLINGETKYLEDEKNKTPLPINALKFEQTTVKCKEL